MDTTNGQMLNDFMGHDNSSYRCRACFGHGEASVVCGDEKGMIWAWDLLDVCRTVYASRIDTSLTYPLGKTIAPSTSSQGAR
jgi:hypothetical protein